MKVSIIAFILLSFLACKSDKTEKSDATPNTEQTTASEISKINQHIDIPFDAEKWNRKDGEDYPYRDQMLNAVIYNDELRALDKENILVQLGAPTRSNENYLYYRIAQKRLGFWTLHTKTLVIKFTADNKIDWMKIHE